MDAEHKRRGLPDVLDRALGVEDVRDRVRHARGAFPPSQSERDGVGAGRRRHPQGCTGCESNRTPLAPSHRLKRAFSDGEAKPTAQTAPPRLGSVQAEEEGVRVRHQARQGVSDSAAEDGGHQQVADVQEGAAGTRIDGGGLAGNHPSQVHQSLLRVPPGASGHNSSQISGRYEDAEPRDLARPIAVCR